MANTVLDRTHYNTLVDDDGSGNTGSSWDKADVDAMLDAVDAAFANSSGFGIGGPLYARNRSVAEGDWQSYTPVLGNQIGATPLPSVGNGTLVGKYTVVGKTVHWRAIFTWGSTSNVGNTSSAVTFTLPTTPAATTPLWTQVGAVTLIDATVGMVPAYQLPLSYIGGQAVLMGWFHVLNSSFTPAAGDMWSMSGTYETT